MEFCLPVHINSCVFDFKFVKTELKEYPVHKSDHSFISQQFQHNTVVYIKLLLQRGCMSEILHVFWGSIALYKLKKRSQLQYLIVSWNNMKNKHLCHIDDQTKYCNFLAMAVTE